MSQKRILSNTQLSTENFSTIIYFDKAEPDFEFEIFHRARIDANIIRVGMRVPIRYGNAKGHGIVVTISDDQDYLLENFYGITETFMAEHGIKIRSRESAVEEASNLQARHDTAYIEKEYVATSNKATQTEDVSYLQHLESRYEVLKSLCGDLKVKTKINAQRKTILSHTDSIQAISKVTRTENNNSKMTGHNDTTSLIKEHINNDVNMNEVCIGSGGSTVPYCVIKAINWSNYSSATRKLLIALFPRHALGTHSLTGKPSPAFVGLRKSAKKKLDDVKVSDIIEFVSLKFKVSPSLVRSVITNKCADENKRLKNHRTQNKENIREISTSTDDLI